MCPRKSVVCPQGLGAVSPEVAAQCLLRGVSPAFAVLSVRQNFRAGVLVALLPCPCAGSGGVTDGLIRRGFDHCCAAVIDVVVCPQGMLELIGGVSPTPRGLCPRRSMPNACCLVCPSVCCVIVAVCRVRVIVRRIMNMRNFPAGACHTWSPCPRVDCGGVSVGVCHRRSVAVAGHRDCRCCRVVCPRTLVAMSGGVSPKPRGLCPRRSLVCDF